MSINAMGRWRQPSMKDDLCGLKAIIQELLNNAKEGDDHAAGQLLDRHRDALRRMVEMRLDRRIQQRVDASDIVQEVMIEANRRLRKYLDDPVMPFHLWLRQMAKDRIIDAHRRHRASGKRSVDREQGMVAPAAMDRSTSSSPLSFVTPNLHPPQQRRWGCNDVFSTIENGRS